MLLPPRRLDGHAAWAMDRIGRTWGGCIYLVALALRVEEIFCHLDDLGRRGKGMLGGVRWGQENALGFDKIQGYFGVNGKT